MQSSVAIYLFDHDKFWTGFLAKNKPLLQSRFCSHNHKLVCTFSVPAPILEKFPIDICLSHYIDLNSTSAKPLNFWAAKWYFGWIMMLRYSETQLSSPCWGLSCKNVFIVLNQREMLKPLKWLSEAICCNQFI